MGKCSLFSRSQIAIGWLVTLVCSHLAWTNEQPADHTNAERDLHWSYRKIEPSPLPAVEHPEQLKNPIDAFILQRLEANQLELSRTATTEIQLRRPTLDLIGVLPDPEELSAFLSEKGESRHHRPDATERLHDRLLASPHYGERWSQVWMDLCHYADTDGYLTDQLRPIAWRYRDWLVTALNSNLPFDQFTIEQLAGDLLPAATTQQRIATGFLRQTLSNREGGADLEEFRVKQVVDRTHMVGSIWLAMTVGCARCHDHKFEDISQQEFFELYAFFNNADEVNIDAPLPHEEKAFVLGQSAYRQRRDTILHPNATALQALMRKWELRLLEAYHHPGQDAHWDRQWEVLGLIWGGGQGEGQLEGTEIVKLKPSLRTWQQQNDLLDYFLRITGDIDPIQEQELQLAAIQTKLNKLKAESPPATRAATMRSSQTVRKDYIHVRGNFRAIGATVQADTPNILPPVSNATDKPRLDLAVWLVSKANPLTSRVTVNRMWQEFFGRGLVITPDDFGLQGNKPSHAKLLDWLAAEFLRRDFDVKAMHRLIVSSATYQQSSRRRPELVEMDPDNELLARQASIRVRAEVIRDISLKASGLLSQKMGGPSVYPPQPERVTKEAFGHHEWPVSSGTDRFRRSLYTFMIRTTPFAQNAIFDAPNPTDICTRRDRSNTAIQALTLLNDEGFFEMAQGLGERLLRQSELSDLSRIQQAVRICLTRSPTVGEQKKLQAFIENTRLTMTQDRSLAESMLENAPDDLNAVELATWTTFSSILLNLHEFITRD
ncbi:MAG: DUF1549 and DUF1553 domain-containing protein [Pirellulaceae bacterium]|nr:DUF1549 and DUF1553 domain-containing protein [Pirellulaceae bacterium]